MTTRVILWIRKSIYTTYESEVREEYDRVPSNIGEDGRDAAEFLGGFKSAANFKPELIKLLKRAWNEYERFLPDGILDYGTTESLRLLLSFN
jgi:hypothetical protein